MLCVGVVGGGKLTCRGLDVLTRGIFVISD